jgi:hypothetical protein
LVDKLSPKAIMLGRIAFLAVAILTFCGISAAADNELRRKRRVLHIDSVDDEHNLHSASLTDSDLWGRHLAVGSPDGGDKKKGGKKMMKGMMMDGKKSGGMMSKGAMGGKNKGGMKGMMVKKKKADMDDFWGGVLNDFSMSMPGPTSSPTIELEVESPTPTPVPTYAPTPVSTNFDPTNPPLPTPVATAPPTSAPFFVPTASPTEAPVVVTDTPSEAPITPTDTPTLSPNTVCRSKTRSDAFFSILEDVTSPDLLNNPSTPQGFAYDFLVNVDPAMVDPCTYPTVEQRYALVSLFSSTDGPDWTIPTGWLTAANECDWYGVECNANDLVTGLFLGK